MKISDKSGFDFELIIKLALLILGLYIIIGSIELGLGTLEEPECGLFPFIGGVVIFVSDIFLWLEGRRSTEPLFKSRNEIKIFVTMAFTFIFWILAMPLLGYLIVTFLGTILISKILKLEGWLKPLALAVGVTLFIYLLFDYFFYIDLPRGFLG